MKCDLFFDLIYYCRSATLYSGRITFAVIYTNKNIVFSKRNTSLYMTFAIE
jgi:hypothetical protein